MTRAEILSVFTGVPPHPTASISLTFCVSEAARESLDTQLRTIGGSLNKQGVAFAGSGEVWVSTVTPVRWSDFLNLAPSIKDVYAIESDVGIDTGDF